MTRKQVKPAQICPCISAQEIQIAIAKMNSTREENDSIHATAIELIGGSAVTEIKAAMAALQARLDVNELHIQDIKALVEVAREHVGFIILLTFGCMALCIYAFKEGAIVFGLFVAGATATLVGDAVCTRNLILEAEAVCVKVDVLRIAAEIDTTTEIKAEKRGKESEKKDEEEEEAE